MITIMHNIIESPYAREIALNVEHTQKCMADWLIKSCPALASKGMLRFFCGPLEQTEVFLFGDFCNCHTTKGKRRVEAPLICLQYGLTKYCLP